jgi:hypothetical protein
VLVLVAVVAGAFGFDASRSDLIARGVHVGTVDVGGLRADGPASAWAGACSSRCRSRS